MNTTYNTSMFDQIRSALTKSSSSSNTKYRDILKFQPGNIYTVRLLPNVNDPDNTIYQAPDRVECH